MELIYCRETGRADLHKMNDINMANPRVFFDMTVDGVNAGRIVMEVRYTIRLFT